ncbi:homeobox protein Meis1a isoform X2 [Syngnathoides biaculeatus]|uniref:homeobox protein Meis1a isoform X2 n=1 Tax=Syngnathoides biaculeatus TaxID=300417 RepID=UPI002ADE79D5|nr:homeobox protein Meis1a isoform X2 [Syngnathoides biaculeatus]XP_061685404.1 homeobox protein Meis1a isoform X2 [Syngnathoides biaculeatus]XP_061685405.1 homeobox protein Meis1a isoform X2 [Syngnathoides biaculeatus]
MSVHELCDNFCARYVSCLKGKMPIDLVIDDEDNHNPLLSRHDNNAMTSARKPLLTPQGHHGDHRTHKGNEVGGGLTCPIPGDDEEDSGCDVNHERPRHKKRGVFPKAATNILRAWLFQHLVFIRLKVHTWTIKMIRTRIQRRTILESANFLCCLSLLSSRVSIRIHARTRRSNCHMTRASPSCRSTTGSSMPGGELFSQSLTRTTKLKARPHYMTPTVNQYDNLLWTHTHVTVTAPGLVGGVATATRTSGTACNTTYQYELLLEMNRDSINLFQSPPPPLQKNVF